jgi:hypothetical protein
VGITWIIAAVFVLLAIGAGASEGLDWDRPDPIWMSRAALIGCGVILILCVAWMIFG